MLFLSFPECSLSSAILLLAFHESSLILGAGRSADGRFEEGWHHHTCRGSPVDLRRAGPEAGFLVAASDGQLQRLLGDNIGKRHTSVSVFMHWLVVDALAARLALQRRVFLR